MPHKSRHRYRPSQAIPSDRPHSRLQSPLPHPTFSFPSTPSPSHPSHPTTPRPRTEGRGKLRVNPSKPAVDWQVKRGRRGGWVGRAVRVEMGSVKDMLMELDEDKSDDEKVWDEDDEGQSFVTWMDHYTAQCTAAGWADVSVYHPLSTTSDDDKEDDAEEQPDVVVEPEQPCAETVNSADDDEWCQVMMGDDTDDDDYLIIDDDMLG